MIVLSYDLVRERVAHGAALLDEKSPGWWRTLVPESIDVRYYERCVLGSINPEAGYLALVYELGLDPVDFDELVARGFDVEDEYSSGSESHRESYARVTDTWRNLIVTRQIEAGLR